MSFSTLKIRYIFFLLFLIGYFYPNFSCSQSINNKENHSEESSQYIGDILFTANINGLIENCKCGKPPLGGLPQISTLINEAIIKNKFSYFIDGGDFLNTYPYPELNYTVIDIFKILDIKYLALGDQEWIDTDDVDQKIINEFKSKIIASNFRIKNFELKNYGQLDLENEMKAYILAYLDKKSFLVSDDKKNIQFNDKLFEATYNDIITKNGLNILLFHGTKYILNSIVKKFSDFNLILWAHEQNNVENISTNPAIIGGGSDGEYLKQVNIYYNKNEFNFDVRSIPVSLEIEEDSQIRLKINEFKLDHKAENNQE